MLRIQLVLLLFGSHFVMQTDACIAGSPYISGTGNVVEVDTDSNGVRVVGDYNKLVGDPEGSTLWIDGSRDSAYLHGSGFFLTLTGSDDEMTIDGFDGGIHNIAGNFDKTVILGDSNQDILTGNYSIMRIEGGHNEARIDVANYDVMQVAGDHNYAVTALGDHQTASVTGQHNYLFGSGDFFKGVITGDFNHAYAKGDHDSNMIQGSFSESDIITGDWDKSTVVGNNLTAKVEGNDNRVLLAGKFHPPAFQSGSLSVFVRPQTAVGMGTSPIKNEEGSLTGPNGESLSSTIERIRARLVEAASAGASPNSLREMLQSELRPADSVAERSRTLGTAKSKVLAPRVSSQISRTKQLNGMAGLKTQRSSRDPIVVSVFGDNTCIKIQGRIDELHVSGENVRVKASVPQQVDSTSPIGDGTVSVYVVGNYADLTVLGEIDLLVVQGDHNTVAAGFKGEAGDDGDNNYEPGEPGDQGEQGSDGTDGEVGDAGDTGADGTSGTLGQKGDKGADGVKGAQGDAGLKGESGDKGLKGAKGPVGQNDPGTPVNGCDGPKGQPGSVIGYQGDQGLQGPQGDQGEKGDHGQCGPKGVVGKPGIKGPLGDQGAVGATGAAGPQGDAGDQGNAGTTGATGPSGSIGIQGATGPQGDTGDAGATGPSGGYGPAGPSGSTGAAGQGGDKAPPGPQGANGSTGSAGAPGNRGPKGYHGPTGPRGDRGAKGVKGDDGDVDYEQLLEWLQNSLPTLLDLLPSH